MSMDMSAAFPSRAGSRLGHWGAQILIAAILAAIALRLRPLPAGTTAALVVPISVLLIVIGSWLLMRQHDRRLCEHCMAAMPLDATKQAARYRTRFDVAHLGQRRALIVGYLALLIGSNFIPGLVGEIIWTVMQLSMVYLVLSYSTHRRLQPWCPYCSGGGGENEDVDAPEPLPQGYQPA
jgi:hypothetical protein